MVEMEGVEVMLYSKPTPALPIWMYSGIRDIIRQNVVKMVRVNGSMVKKD
jgi:hypothetical protein